MAIDGKVSAEYEYVYEVRHKPKRDSGGVHLTSELYLGGRIIDSKGAYKCHDDSQSDDELEAEHVSFFASRIMMDGRMIKVAGNKIMVLKD